MSSAAPLSDSHTPQLLTHSPTPPGGPSNDDIEAVIKMATSSRPSTDRPAPLRDTRTQLFVGNLPYRVRWQDLKDLFRRAGTVLRADVSLGPDNRSRGYGTVLLATAEDAGRAIDMLHGYCWQTRVLEVRPDRLGAGVDEMAMNAPASAGYVSPTFNLAGINGSSNGYDEFTVGIAANTDLLSGGTGMRSLFVGNLPFHIQWQDLKDLFRAAGAVARADVALGPDGRSRGFGTVTFLTEDGAERARRMFDGYEFNGRPLKVHYDKFAQSAQTIPLVGVSPQPVTTSILSHDSLPHAGITPQLYPFDALNANPGDLQAHLDALARARSRLDLHPRTHVESSLDALTSTQLDALLMQSHSSLTSPSPVPHVQSHSQSPSHLHSPPILHSQLQSLAVSAAQPLTPTPTHSLSQPHSLTGSPLPVTNSNAFGSLCHSDLSSSNLPVDSLSLATDRGLATDLKYTSELTSRASSFSSPRPSLSTGSSSQPTSFVSSTSGSQRSTLSAGSSRTDLLSEGLGLGFGSQRPSLSASARPSFGSTNAEKPSLTSLTSERRSFISQRPSLSSTSSQRPNFGSSQRSTAFLGTPFLEDDGPAASSSQVPTLGALRPAMPLSMPGSWSGSHVGEIGTAGGSASRGSPPSLKGSGGVSSTWPDLTGVASPRHVGAEAEPSSRKGPTQISPKSLVDKTSPRAAVLAQSILNTGPAPSESVWSVSKTAQPSQETASTKANGTGDVDHVATALGALGLRRANKKQNGQAEDKKKQGSSPDQQTSSAATSTGQKQSQSTTSHRHPGPISLPPPTNFTLPHPVMLSPHTHPHSPIYHPGYPLSPMHHPMGSPLHHPMGSPLHHPVHVHSPLHHPGHSQYGTYPPMHYGVMTPHGLPPITPSMPPFTFLPPQARAQGQAQGQNLNGNEHGRELRTSEDGNSDQGSRSEGGRSDGHNETAPPQPPYYSRPPHAPPLHMPYASNVHPPFFPGIPVSPGMIMPLSPGMMPPPVSMSMMSMPSVPMSPAGVPVPMTPGVAMTPGVTMTPGAFWPHAPWINPAVGAPVHVHADGQGGAQYPGGEGYFPPVSKPGGDTGYFPPVSVANEILKEGSGFGSSDLSEGHGNGSDGTDSESRSPSTNMSRTSPSPDTSHEGLEEGTSAQPIKRTSSVQCEVGFSKRGSLMHRESDPAMTMTMTNSGGVSREA